MQKQWFWCITFLFTQWSLGYTILLTLTEPNNLVAAVKSGACWNTGVPLPLSSLYRSVFTFHLPHGSSWSCLGSTHLTSTPSTTGWPHMSDHMNCSNSQGYKSPQVSVRHWMKFSIPMNSWTNEPPRRMLWKHIFYSLYEHWPREASHSCNLLQALWSMPDLPWRLCSVPDFPGYEGDHSQIQRDLLCLSSSPGHLRGS